jgi:hypothetical protein
VFAFTAHARFKRHGGGQGSGEACDGDGGGSVPEDAQVAVAAQQENGDGGDESRQAGATVSRRRPFTRGRGGRRMRRGRRGCADAPETGKMDGLGWIAAHQESSRMH